MEEITWPRQDLRELFGELLASMPASEVDERLLINGIRPVILSRLQAGSAIGYLSAHTLRSVATAFGIPARRLVDAFTVTLGLDRD